MDNLIPLSSIDHIFTGTGSYPIEFIFAYNGTIDPEKLSAALKKTMKHFPPASARLVKLTEHAFAFKPEPDCYAFEVVESKVGFKDITRHSAFIDPVETFENELLTRIRLTQTPSGSVLGVSMSHAVADGFGYFFFLANWARIFHGQPPVPAAHERSLLIRESHEHVDAEIILKKAGLFYGEKRSFINRDAIRWETIHYPYEKLKSILEDAQKESAARLSHNDIVTSLLWKTTMSEWNANDDDQLTYISCPVDYRRLLKGFPKTYFGNAVALATTPLPYDTLMEASPAELALKVRESIAAVNENYIMGGLEALNALNRREGLGSNEKIHVCHPHNGLLVTNLSRLPVNDIVFDAGPPVAYEILTPVPRGAVVLPHKDGIVVRISYPED